MTPDFELAIGGMKAIPNWFTWRLTWNDVKKKFEKKPCSPDGSIYPRDASDPTLWTDYATAAANTKRLDPGYNSAVRFAIGFRLTENCGYFLFDHDKCYVNSKLDSFTQDMLDKFPGAMLEYSSSAQGIHIIGRCSPLAHRQMCAEHNMEFYTSDRGIAFGLDGRAWGSADANFDIAVAKLVEDYFKPRPINGGAVRAAEWRGPDNNDELLKRICSGRKSERELAGAPTVEQLMSGQVEQDSNNDARLAAKLAYWTGRDVDRIEFMMRNSKLYRPKWDTYRPLGGSYIRMTILNACEFIGDVYDEQKYALGSDSERVASKNTELANAYRLKAKNGQDLLHVPGIGWHHWGERGPWKSDGRAAHRLAFGLGKAIKQEATDLDVWVGAAVQEGLAVEERKLREEVQRSRAAWAKASESKAVIEHSLSLAEKLLGANADELDTAMQLVGCPGGVLDLESGMMREHRREDRITKTIACDYDPLAKAPIWTAFVSEILGGDQQLINYVQTLCGYVLSGKRGEHLLPILWGTGANGKSTFLSTLQALLADYGGTAAPGLLLSRGGNEHPTGLASLQGRRMIVVSETGEAGRLNEEQVKSLTGGDRITARRMRQDFYEFQPTHLIFLQTNHKPRVMGTDVGIWRRLKLIPFLVTIPPERRDPELPGKLRAELPGILAWAVEGFKKYQQAGFVEAAAVMAATAEYRDASDQIGAFLADACTVGGVGTVGSAELYRAFQRWCEDAGERPGTQRAFSMRLAERGFEKKDTRSGVRWLGVSLVLGSGLPSLHQLVA